MNNNHGTLIIIGMLSSALSFIFLFVILILTHLSMNNKDDRQDSTIEGSQVCLQLKLKNVEPGQLGLETGAYNG